MCTSAITIDPGHTITWQAAEWMIVETANVQQLVRLLRLRGDMPT